MTPEEVAELARASIHTVRYWRAAGDGPPGFRVGRRVRYRREAVEQWLRDREVNDAIQPRSVAR
jgi:excisionase family DNA binding protein